MKIADPQKIKATLTLWQDNADADAVAIARPRIRQHIIPRNWRKV